MCPFFPSFFLYSFHLSFSLSPARLFGWVPRADADRAQKHGMDEFISANPCNFDHASLFELVQRLTLDHRLNDSYSCLVSKLYHANCSLVNQEASQVRYTRRPSLSHYRAGLVLARYLSWTNTALATASEAVIATCVTWATYWRGRRTEP